MKTRPDWTVDVVAKLHKYGITSRQLAKHSGYAVTYVSALLTGARIAAENTEKKIKNALDEMIAEIDENG